LAIYRRINWGAGPVTAEKLNAMVENIDYVNERMLTGHWETFGMQKETNLRVQGMRVWPQQQINNVSRFANAYWPKPFSPGCSPIIVAGHYYTEKVIHSIGIKNINGSEFADNAGFRLEVYAGDSGYGSEWAGGHSYGVIALGW
jgi:hypothetical protein